MKKPRVSRRKEILKIRAEINAKQTKETIAKINNLNKMKRQRNTQQIKEQDKCPPNQTKEEEIGNLPDKEFRVRRVKWI